MLDQVEVDSADLTVPHAAKNQADLASSNKSALCRNPTPRGTPTHLIRVLFGEQGLAFQLSAREKTEISALRSSPQQ